MSLLYWNLVLGLDLFNHCGNDSPFEELINTKPSTQETISRAHPSVKFFPLSFPAIFRRNLTLESAETKLHIFFRTIAHKLTFRNQ